MTESCAWASVNNSYSLVTTIAKTCGHLPMPLATVRPAGFFTFSSGAATRWSRNCFPTQQGGFCTPGTGGSTTGATDEVPVPSTGTATEVGPLTSSPPSSGQSSGRALWTSAYAPGNGQTSWVYSSNPVLHLYISCYLTVNKPVLSYLLFKAGQ
jgi:hypothetical protein